ncbi:MAG: hypothetical protein JW760_04870 [Spirochaetales bacterium]|nr:hypothetical protein [Spirochaetales bacterium]
MNHDCVIGVDCGTSAVKAAVWKSDGQAAASGRVSLEIENPRPSFYEQDPEDWVEGFYGAVRQAVDTAGKKAHIHAISVSHQRETFVPVKGRPLRKAILWMDRRADPMVYSLRSRIGQERFRAITGKTLSGNLSLVKLAWLREEERDVFTSAAFFCDVQSYILKVLTGNLVTGTGSADPMGLFDMPLHRWSEEVLSMIDLDEKKLPPVLEPGSVAGYLREGPARKCGLEKGIPVVIGLGDGQSAGMGCGITGGGESYLSLGTSVVSGTIGENFIAEPEFRTSFGGIQGSYFFETVILGGAHTLTWFFEKLNPGAKEAFLRKKADTLEPGSGGLLMVPYLNGAMNPYWDQEARGIIIGLSLNHGPEHIYRSILEGIAFEQRLHTDGLDRALKSHGAPTVSSYVVSGGGSFNDLWLQIIADVTGRRVCRTLGNEAGALGAGILAATAAGFYPDVRSAAASMVRRDSKSIEPIREAQDVYDSLYRERYTKLYPAVSGI